MCGRCTVTLKDSVQRGVAPRTAQEAGTQPQQIGVVVFDQACAERLAALILSLGSITVCCVELQLEAFIFKFSQEQAPSQAP